MDGRRKEGRKEYRIVWLEEERKEGIPAHSSKTEGTGDLDGVVWRSVDTGWSCIEAKFLNQRLVRKLLTRSFRFTLLCTFGIQSRKQEKTFLLSATRWRCDAAPTS